MHKLFRDFEIQTDQQISVRRPDLVIVNNKKKRTWRIFNGVVPPENRVKRKESEKRDKYLDLAKELKINYKNGR